MELKEIDIRLTKAYDTYINIICPMIMQLEVLTTEFPISILNEIRAFTTHVAKIYQSTNILIKEDNLLKAERHIKRMLLDCYKYTCIAFDDEYKTFQHLYKNVDLSVIDNGEFIAKIISDKKIVSKQIQDAKLQELSADTDENDIFEKYENAYNLYFELIAYIKDHFELLNKVKHKYITKTIVNNIIGIIGILGTIFTVISFVLQISQPPS